MPLKYNETEPSPSGATKRKLIDDETSDESHKARKLTENELAVENMPHYSFIMDLKIDNSKMEKAELCGLHLAEKLKEQGADVIIRECKAQTLKS